MINLIYQHRATIVYFLSYAMKGLSFYVVLFVLNNSGNTILSGEFFGYFSILLVLVPVFGMGLASYFLRYSYSEKKKTLLLSIASKNYLLLASISFVVYLFVDDSYVLIFSVTCTRIMSTIFEAHAISSRLHVRVSLFYIGQVLIYLILAFLIYIKKFTDVNEVLTGVLVVDSLSIYFLVSAVLRGEHSRVFWSRRFMQKVLSYGIPIVLLGFSLGLFVNVDKILLKWTGYVHELADYGFLFALVFSLHRFVTTPYIMQVSRVYFSSLDVEPALNKKVLVGLVFIFVSYSLLILALYYWYSMGGGCLMLKPWLLFSTSLSVCTF